MRRSGRPPAGGSRFFPGRWLAVRGGDVAVWWRRSRLRRLGGAIGSQTGTIWIPLFCKLGTVPVHVGAAFTATVPTRCIPGEEFDLQNAFATIDIPAASNAAALAFGNPNEVEGVGVDFDTNLTNGMAPTLVKRGYVSHQRWRGDLGSGHGHRVV